MENEAVLIILKIRHLSLPGDVKWEFTLPEPRGHQRTLSNWEANPSIRCKPDTASDIAGKVWNEIGGQKFDGQKDPVLKERLHQIREEILKLIRDIGGFEFAAWPSEVEFKAWFRERAKTPRGKALASSPVNAPASEARHHPHLDIFDSVWKTDRGPTSNLLSPQWRFPEEIVARDQEQRWLRDFLQLQPENGKDHDLMWWVLIGAAGSGKTRLALELCIHARQKGWDAGFLKELPEKPEDAAQWQFERPTLIVIDSVAPRAEAVGRIAGALLGSGRKLEHPLRLLLLERRLTAMWQEQFMCAGGEITRNQRYQADSLRGSLVLRRLEEDEFVGIYERALMQLQKGKATRLTEQQKQEILKADEHLRPLHAVAAAVMRFRTGGKSNPCVGNPLSAYVMHEADQWRKENVDDAHVNLLVLATIVGGLQLDYAEARIRANAKAKGTGVSLIDINAPSGRRNEVVPSSYDNYRSDWVERFWGFAGVVESNSGRKPRFHEPHIITVPGVQPDLLGETLFKLRVEGHLVMGLGRSDHVQAETKTLWHVAKKLHFRRAVEFEGKYDVDFPPGSTAIPNSYV